MSRSRYKTKEFAFRAGVTVRTLHFYDRLGLLRPAERTQTGHRLYGGHELERLEQIVALRFVGFDLDRIKELLDGPRLPLAVMLRMQRQIVRGRRDQLDRAIEAIERAEAAIAADEEATPWEALRQIIEVTKMEKSDWSWTKNYYSPDAQEKIEARAAATSKTELEEGQRAWTQLIAEVEAAARTDDPGSDRAQTLARRWKALVAEFTGGDPAVQSGLNKLWSDSAHWPKDFKRPWSDQADRFIKAAMNCNA